jgi:hypothetical protein
MLGQLVLLLLVGLLKAEVEPAVPLEVIYVIHLAKAKNIFI